MNWSEPSIRAEQALKRANQRAEDGDLSTAMLEWDAVVTYANQAFEILEQRLSARDREKTATTTP